MTSSSWVDLSTMLATGPGNCLGVIAAKSGPTAVRGQYYGVAAATGKVGAFVGTWGEYFLSHHCCNMIDHETSSLPSYR